MKNINDAIDPSQKIVQVSNLFSIVQKFRQEKMEKMCSIITKESKKYKIGVDLLRKYSTFFSVMLQDEVVEQLELSHISSGAFDYVYQFLQLHKSNPPKQVSKPVVRKVKLSAVMSEEDAELMERINSLDTQLKLEIMNAAMYLQMDSFKKLLTYALMQKQLEQEVTVIETSADFEEEIKREIQSKINNLIEMENHRKRLENQVFEEYPEPV